MANAEHLDILKQGVEAWNQWRHQNPHTKPGLYGANLRWGHLGKVNLEGADLIQAQLQGAILTGATGLTKDQIDLAIINEGTILPEDLK